MPGTADEARAYWRASRVPVTDWLAAARDAHLDEVRPSHDGATRTAAGWRIDTRTVVPRHAPLGGRRR